MPGIRKDSGPQKYNKVNQQRKFHLLSLFYTHQVPLKEVLLLLLRPPTGQESTTSPPRPSSSFTRKNTNLTSLTSDSPQKLKKLQKLGLLTPRSGETINFLPKFNPHSPQFRSFVQQAASLPLPPAMKFLILSIVLKRICKFYFKLESRERRTGEGR
jgi:hypothetical protein